MSAGTYNTTLEQGATFSRTLTYKDAAGNAIDLTGYTARMQARPYVGSPNKVLDLTTENGGISIAAATGKITWTVAASVTAAIKQDSLVYDLELIAPDGTVTRVIQGTLTVSKR